MSTSTYLYLAITLAVFILLWWLGAKRGLPLWGRVFVALFVGAFVGYFFPEGVEVTKWIGDVFIRLIKMLIVPLIFTTLVSGVIAMGDPKRLGSLGAKTIAIYMLTTAAAISIGLFLGTIFAPGAGVDVSTAAPGPIKGAAPLAERLIGIVPTNPIAAFVEGDVLAIILFAILFGIGIIVAGKRGEAIGKAIDSAAHVMLEIAHMVMEVAPYGVFALVAWAAGTLGPDALANLAVLAMVVYGGCFIHIIVVHGGLIRFVLGLPAVRFFRGIFDAQAVAYSTASSSATLPVTITCAEENLGVKRTVSSSVLPLGATINMDGTALYLGIVAMFAAQVFGVDVGLTEYLLIALTVTLVSVGAAGIPSAGLFLLATVLSVIGISDAQTAMIIGFILPFDRILDMMRTVVNVTGDTAVAVAVAKWEGELDEDTFRATATV
ncbi:MAG: dicarboxylate/amino acid:cation symporter [Gammaproteobacteria bacterium]